MRRKKKNVLGVMLVLATTEFVACCLHITLHALPQTYMYLSNICSTATWTDQFTKTHVQLMRPFSIFALC